MLKYRPLLTLETSQFQLATSATAAAGTLINPASVRFKVVPRPNGMPRKGSFTRPLAGVLGLDTGTYRLVLGIVKSICVASGLDMTRALAFQDRQRLFGVYIKAILGHDRNFTSTPLLRVSNPAALSVRLTLTLMVEDIQLRPAAMGPAPMSPPLQHCLQHSLVQPGCTPPGSQPPHQAGDRSHPRHHDEDELANRLPHEEQRQPELRAKGEEAERAAEARRLEEEEGAKCPGARPDHPPRAPRPPYSRPGTIPRAHFGSLIGQDDDDQDLAELQALARLSANPLPRPPKSKLRPMSTATDDTQTSATDAARRTWANNLRDEWERRGAHELDRWLRYRHASSENIAAAAQAAARRHAEEMRRYHEHMEEIKYWACYERGWMDLLDSVIADGRQTSLGLS
ncbi:hypothetical protein FRC10_007829 [Ceratobasidium sp. 414]|nr:hypothetical protein FRC10_007829 [Ceratobasidium sp. 414]